MGVSVALSVGTGLSALSDGFAPWVGADVHPLNPTSMLTANAGITNLGMPAHVTERVRATEGYRNSWMAAFLPCG